MTTLAWTCGIGAGRGRWPARWSRRPGEPPPPPFPEGPHQFTEPLAECSPDRRRPPQDGLQVRFHLADVLVAERRFPLQRPQHHRVKPGVRPEVRGWGEMAHG